MFTCLECQCTYSGTGPRCEQCAKIVAAQADDASAGFNQAPEKYLDMVELYSKMFPSPRNAMLVKDMAASKVGGPALNTMVGLWNKRDWDAQWSAEQLDKLAKSPPIALNRIQSVVIGTDPGGRSYSVDEHGEFHVDDPVDKVAVDLSTTRVLR